MPELSEALAVSRSMRAPMSPEVSASGTGWGHGNTLGAKRVPVVPSVPISAERDRKDGDQQPSADQPSSSLHQAATR